MNQILNQLNNAQSMKVSPQLIANAKKLMQTPQQMNQMMQMLGGRDPKQVFYTMCKQKGINPDDVLNQIR